MSNRININVRVESGTRTPVKVSAYTTGVNDKRLGGVGSSKQIPAQRIVEYIEKSVTDALKTYFEQQP